MAGRGVGKLHSGTKGRPRCARGPGSVVTGEAGGLTRRGTLHDAERGAYLVFSVSEVRPVDRNQESCPLLIKSWPSWRFAPEATWLPRLLPAPVSPASCKSDIQQAGFLSCLS